MNYEDLHINGSCECVYNGEIILAAKIMLITPEIAAEMLTHNLEKNRNIQKTVVNKYSKDMEADRWSINAESIAFDFKGNLTNGQHRLTSIVKSGKPMLCIVGFADSSVYDVGKGRTVQDIATINGDDIKELTGTRLAGTAKLILKMKNHVTSVSHVEALDFIRENKDIFTWLKKCPVQTSGSQGISTASTLAAIATAYRCGYPVNLLNRFADVLCTGFCSGEIDRPIISLRDYLTSPKNVGKTGSSSQLDRYGRTQYILYAYASDNTKAKCRQNYKEYYKWP
jgi:hypothetical protein